MSSPLPYHKYYDALKSNPSHKNKFDQELRQSESIIVQLIRNFITQQSYSNSPIRILDMGCGDGTFTRHIEAIFPQAEVHGWDAGKKIIEISKSLSSSVQWNYYNCFESTDLINNYSDYFDIVIVVATTQVLSSSSAQQLLPLDSINHFLNQVHQVLCPGGLLINFDCYHDFEECDLISHSFLSNPKLNDIDSILPSQSYHYPSKNWLLRTLFALGFCRININDFNLKDISIPPASLPGETYTELNPDQEIISKLCLIEQPWAHVTAYLPN